MRERFLATIFILLFMLTLASFLVPLYDESSTACCSADVCVTQNHHPGGVK